MLKYAALLLTFTFSAGCIQSEEVAISNIPYGHPAAVVLTFDTEVAGSKELEMIGRVLKERDANATFFVVAGYYRDRAEALEPLSDFEVGSKGWNESSWVDNPTPEEQSGQMLRAHRWLIAHGHGVKGFRTPHLTYSEFTGRAARELGYTYDSSLYYGFFPYRADGVVEVPLSINFDPFWDEKKMEHTLLPTYLVLQQAVDVNGFFAMLTHASRAEENMENFTRFLDYAESRGLWLCSAGEAAEWWEKRKKLRLERSGEKLVIENTGSEEVKGTTVIVEGSNGEIEGGTASYEWGEKQYIVLPPIEPSGKAALELTG